MLNVSREHQVVTISALILAGLAMSWFLTNPDQLGPFGITVWFGLLLISLSGIIIGLRYYLATLRGTPRNLRKISRQSILVAAWVTAILGLNSLRQLDVKDIVLVSVLAVLGEVYWRKA